MTYEEMIAKIGNGVRPISVARSLFGKAKPSWAVDLRNYCWNKLTAEDLQKLEIAEEIGVIDKIYAGGYGNLTSKESGKIGGILAARNKAKKK